MLLLGVPVQPSMNLLQKKNIKVKTINFGISDHFPSIGGISEQRKDYQLDKDKIVKKIKERLSK